MAPALEVQGVENVSQNNGLNNVDDVTNRSKVTVIGSGNWGSVASKLIASNTIRMNNFHGNFLCYNSLLFEFIAFDEICFRRLSCVSFGPLNFV